MRLHRSRDHVVRLFNFNGLRLIGKFLDKGSPTRRRIDSIVDHEISIRGNQRTIHHPAIYARRLFKSLGLLEASVGKIHKHDLVFLVHINKANLFCAKETFHLGIIRRGIAHGFGIDPQMRRCGLDDILIVEEELFLVGHANGKQAVVQVFASLSTLGVIGPESNDVIRVGTPFRILELALPCRRITHQVPKHFSRRIGHRKTVMLFHHRSRVYRIGSFHIQRAAKVQPEHGCRVIFRVLGHGRITNLHSTIHFEQGSNIRSRRFSGR